MWVAYPDESNLEEIKKIIAKYFNVYEAKQEEGIMAFYVDLPADENILQEKFEFLRIELKKRNLIPFLREKAGESIIFIVYKEPVKGRPIWVNIALFIATVITTTISGEILFIGYNGGKLTWETFLSAYKILYGFLFFSLPLLAILGVHETALYIASKKHGVMASLPFFIPIPPNPILPLGTMGAVISMREPIPDRKALLDIGVAGPIAGFLVAIPVLLIGLYLMHSHPVIVQQEEGALFINFPLLGMIMLKFLSVPDNALMHPTAFAGWVGLLVTAINLLPAGQLDGGHVARAVLKEKHRYASFATIISLAALSFLGIGNWLLLILLLVFLLGTEHPPALNESVSLDWKRKLLALLALIIFILSFTPMPISTT